MLYVSLSATIPSSTNNFSCDVGKERLDDFRTNNVEVMVLCGGLNGADEKPRDRYTGSELSTYFKKTFQGPRSSQSKETTLSDNNTMIFGGTNKVGTLFSSRTCSFSLPAIESLVSQAIPQLRGKRESGDFIARDTSNNWRHSDVNSCTTTPPLTPLVSWQN